MSDDYPNSVNVSASEDIWQCTSTLQNINCQTSIHVHKISLANTTNSGIITILLHKITQQNKLSSYFLSPPLLLSLLL